MKDARAGVGVADFSQFGLLVGNNNPKMSAEKGAKVNRRCSMLHWNTYVGQSRHRRRSNSVSDIEEQTEVICV